MRTAELSEVEDATLVTMATAGDHEAFETLLGRYKHRIYLMALRILGSPADAEDVAQEVSVTAWRNLAELTDPAAVRTWLFRVTHRQCLAVLKTRRNHEQLDLDLPAPTADPQRVVEAEAGVHALSLALTRLSSNQRRTWLLAEVHGLPHLEIARLSGGTEEAVRSRLQRARGTLAHAMRAWR
ncbi:RNA polymerase sigma factor [Kibdelosporangium lantanae]|uniref:RNA polymerase sigma factor n=1 Tax=Kibdelosporangium lantanae TaxID=1497396 RepID=A0ABW3M3R6_9PSEU